MRPGISPPRCGPGTRSTWQMVAHTHVTAIPSTPGKPRSEVPRDLAKGTQPARGLLGLPGFHGAGPPLPSIHQPWEEGRSQGAGRRE